MSEQPDFFLIERGPNQGQSAHCWWNADEPAIGATWRRGEWVYEAVKATRYTAREDAEKAAAIEHRAGSYAITSHGLLDATPPDRAAASPQALSDAALDAALDEPVAEGESVRFYLESYAFERDDESTRRIMTREVVASAIRAYLRSHS